MKHIVKDVTYIECKYNNGEINYEQKINNEDCNFMQIFEADDESYDLRHNFYFKEGRKK